MLVMVSNQTGTMFGHLATRFPGRIGHLYSPGAQRGPFQFAPYALDNGAFPAWSKGVAWQSGPWNQLLEWAWLAKQEPLWALVPDAVGDRAETLRLWGLHADYVRGLGFRPAFAVQDGMTFDDAPADCVLFLGGTTEWKEAAIGPWCERFPGRVHVGRVNTLRRLRMCHEAGAISVDGTGWFHRRELRLLVEFLEETGARSAA